MTTHNFYTAAAPEYFWHQGRPHYNLGNKMIHSDFYKKINPLRQLYDYQPGQYT